MSTKSVKAIKKWTTQKNLCIQLNSLTAMNFFFSTLLFQKINLYENMGFKSQKFWENP